MGKMSQNQQRAMSPEERQTLLSELRLLASDADEIQSDIKRIFLPLPRYNAVLREQIMVIRGERGVGKTALFHFVHEMSNTGQELGRLFPEAGLPEGAQWLQGFSEAGKDHPMVDILSAYGKRVDDETLRIFWLSHLACRLAKEGSFGNAALPQALQTAWLDDLHEPDRWVQEARAHLGPIAKWLDAVDTHLAANHKKIFVTYDHLDRIGQSDIKIGQRYAGSLLALWMSLANRYRSIQAKIFLREDLFEATRDAFTDASKLASRSISLDWNVESLYRLLIRHMAAISEGMRAWIERTANGIALKREPPLGWMPPATLPEMGDQSQKSFIDHLAGPQMGQGPRKGYTYRWIPNRLQDAHLRIVPRSLLNLIGCAADIACRQSPKARWDRLLHPDELHAALEETSKRRVKELTEEYLVVRRLEHLSGETMMLDAKSVRRKLAKPLSGNQDDGFGDDGQEVMEELVRLGVLKVRSDGRIDVPDIYRYAFGIKRSGGVARPR